MKKVIIILAPGFEEIESITIADILRRAGARVTLAGTEEGLIKGSRDVTVLPDIYLGKVDENDWDMIVLPGGQPGTDNLIKCEKVLAIVKKMHKEHKLIAAICAAPLVLKSAGILNGIHATSHPSVKGQLNESVYSEDRVVVDGNIITSRSPGTAMEFSLKLVEALFGMEMVDKINSGVMAKI